MWFDSWSEIIRVLSDVAWSEGVTALALLAALQFAVAWTTTELRGGAAS